MVHMTRIVFFTIGLFLTMNDIVKTNDTVNKSSFISTGKMIGYRKIKYNSPIVQRANIKTNIALINLLIGDEF